MKEKLRDLIARDETETAIQQLLEMARSIGDAELQNDILLQSARYEAYAKSKWQGITSQEDQSIAIARINHALLQIISSLPEGADPENIRRISSQTTKNKQRPWWQWVVGAGVIIGILAGLAEFTGFSLRELFGQRSIDSFSLTVLVHGKAGKDDRILRNQGKVVLDFGATREEEAINDKGEATFKELPAGYEGQKARISIDHAQPYFPTDRSAEYTLERGKAIYLEVALQGLGKIQGRVLDYESEQPLDSVRVSYQNITAYTDTFGWYELEIPPGKQEKFIRVSFYKPGFKMVTIDSIAPHTKQEIGISLRKQ